MLLFIWVSEYKGLKNVELNFSDDFKFSFNSEELVLRVEKKNPLPEFFFKISNPTSSSKITVTGLVGENGSGKTTVLELIQDIFVIGIKEDIKILSIVFSKPDFSALHNFGSDIALKIIPDEHSKHIKISPVHYDIKKPGLTHFYLDHFIINYSLIYDSRKSHMSLPEFNPEIKLMLNQEEYYQNISTNYFASKFNNYFRIYYEDLRKIIFYISQRNFNENPFEIPDTIECSLNDIENFKFLNIDKKDFEEIVQPIRRLAFTIINSGREEEFNKDRFLNYIRLYFINLYLSYFGNIIFLISDKELFNDLISNQGDSLITKFELLFEKLAARETREDGNYKKLHILFKIYFKRLDAIFEESNIVIDKKFFENYKFQIKTKTRSNNVISFIRVSKYIESTMRFVNYSWRDISSGEYSFLLLFSRFFNVLHNNSHVKDRKNILILIDEGEMFFHPHWQLSYLSNILSMLLSIQTKKNIQIILTTNSPFVISEIPSSNLIYLSNNKVIEKDVKTFAANFYSLLLEFILSNPKNPLGKFTEANIMNIINYLNKKESFIKSKDEAKRLIDLIGEDVLRFELMKRLKEVDSND